MKKKLAGLKIGVALLVFVSVCAKIAKARWYDVNSKLNVFATNDSHHDDIAS